MIWFGFARCHRHPWLEKCCWCGLRGKDKQLLHSCQSKQQQTLVCVCSHASCIIINTAHCYVPSYEAQELDGGMEVRFKSGLRCTKHAEGLYMCLQKYFWQSTSCTLTRFLDHFFPCTSGIVYVSELLLGAAVRPSDYSGWLWSFMTLAITGCNLRRLFLWHVTKQL